MKKAVNILLTCLLFLSMTGCEGKIKDHPTVLIEGSQLDGLWAYEDISPQSFEAKEAASSQWSISLWIKPDELWPDHSSILKIHNAEEWIDLSADGINNGIYSGLTLSNSRNEWAVADGGLTISTSRWNNLFLQFEKDNVILYLNGEKAVEGPFHGSMKDAMLEIGGDSSISGRITTLVIAEGIKSSKEIRMNYESRYASVLLDTINIPDSDHLKRDLWLVGNTIDGEPVVWTVEDSDVMDSRGILLKKNTEAEIHASASITKTFDDGIISEAKRDFVFHTVGNSDQELLNEDVQALKADIDGVLFAGDSLPMEGENGSSIAWTVSPNAELIDGKLYKTGEEERTPVTLHAVVTHGSLSAEQDFTVTLLDPAYGYVLSYFNGNEGEETGHLSLGTDGVAWQNLKGADFTASKGTKRVRDPQISRAADGSFLIVATEGFDTPYIYLWKSDDLTDIGEPEEILVDVPDQGAGMSGQRAWAPELVYDNENQVYRLYFSDPHDDTGKIFTSVSDDLISFTYPAVSFDPGYPVIDATVFSMNGKYWMMYKDEREGAKTIFYAVSDDLSQPFLLAYDRKFLLEDKGVEGPFVFQDNQSGNCHVYVDQFGKSTFLAGEFSQLGETADFDWNDTEKLSLPEEDVRHGSVLRITEKEYRRLAEKYGLQNAEE